MLSFGLKITWFILSFTGLLSCWVTLWSFGRVVGTKWASIVYCLGTTLAEGIFCLGIVYRMDPFLMARPFCLVQNSLMSAGVFINMGVVLALTFATGTAVRKPKTWGDARRALKWQKIHWLPVVAVPFLATASYLALSFSFGSVRPSDGMWCDSTEPEWIRILGPSGIPFLLSIAVLYLSIQSFLRIKKTNLHLLRSRPECPASPTNIPRTDTQPPAMWRKNSRVSLRDVAMVPVTLALTLTKKSSVASMRVWKGMGRKERVAASGVDGVRFPKTAVPSRASRLQGQREHHPLQATRSVTSSLPPTSLPLALLRSNGSAESSPNASEIAIRHFKIGGNGERRNTLDVHDITLESHRSPQIAELDLEDRTSDFSSTFPTFAKDETPSPTIEKSTSESTSTSMKDQVPADGESIATSTPVRQTFRISLVGVDGEGGADMHQGSACSNLDIKHSNLRTVELVASESVTVDERQDDGVDLRFVVDVEAALKRGEDSEGDSIARRSSISSAVKKRSPAAIVLTLGGPYKKPKHQPAWLAPALWHVILFQFAFVFIQLLAFLTTFIDLVCDRRTPSRFGSQHLALLLAAWCPVVIFGSLPVVRRNLIPWRPISTS